MQQTSAPAILHSAALWQVEASEGPPSPNPSCLRCIKIDVSDKARGGGRVPPNTISFKY